jgi:hypothetical protein
VVVLWVQGKINVIVGCMYKKYNRETGGQLAKQSPFFDDFLGAFEAGTNSGSSNAPYFSKEREAVRLDAQKKKRKILPKGFYEALLKAVASPPDHQLEGASDCFLFIKQSAHYLKRTL